MSKGPTPPDLISGNDVRQVVRDWIRTSPLNADLTPAAADLLAKRGAETILREAGSPHKIQHAKVGRDTLQTALNSDQAADLAAVHKTVLETLPRSKQSRQVTRDTLAKAISAHRFCGFYPFC